MRTLCDLQEKTAPMQRILCIMAVSLTYGILDFIPDKARPFLPNVLKYRKLIKRILTTLAVEDGYCAGATRQMQAALKYVNANTYDEEAPLDEQFREWFKLFAMAQYLVQSATNTCTEWAGKSQKDWDALKRWMFKGCDDYAEQYGPESEDAGFEMYQEALRLMGYAVR